MAAGLVVVGTAALSQPAAAQELNAQRFQPAVDGRELVVLDDSQVGPTGLGGGALFNYADDPFIYRYEDGTTEDIEVLGQVGTLDLAAFYRVSILRLGIAAPLHLSADGFGLDAADGYTLGDLALDAKVQFLDRLEGPLGLGATVRVGLPTGKRPRLAG